MPPKFIAVSPAEAAANKSIIAARKECSTAAGSLGKAAEIVLEDLANVYAQNHISSSAARVAADVIYELCVYRAPVDATWKGKRY